MTASGRKSMVIVTGLSGGGKASILNAMEDVGYETVDNPPLPMLEEMVEAGDRKLAVGVDARTRGFDAAAVLEVIERLRRNAGLRVQLVYAWADESTLLRRYTESRRRHPLAPQGRVVDGIVAEKTLTAALRSSADLVVDTTGLPIAHLRRLIERHFGAASDDERVRMIVSLMSFAYPQGLPREADLVFDARFLRNPHYDPILRPKTGLDPDVGAYIEQDPDFMTFFSQLRDLVDLLLPRFVQEGKKYATITIGCTGGQHRSVHLIEKLANHLTLRAGSGQEGAAAEVPWRIYVTHRELARDGAQDAFLVDRPVAHREDSDIDKVARALSVQA
jgi:RNase adapter protein RapZ